MKKIHYACRPAALAVAAALCAGLCSTAAAAVLVLEGDHTIKNLHSLNGGDAEVYEGLVIDHRPHIVWNQHTLHVSEGASLIINGPTKGGSYADEIEGTGDIGTYLITVFDDRSKVVLNGDVDLEVVHTLSNDEQIVDIGANLLYARNEGSIEVGNAGSTTRLWVLAGRPDLISAKDGGSVVFKSTRNQLVGSIDTMDSASSSHGTSTIQIAFEGADSYWIGDERSWQNYKESQGQDRIETEDVIDLAFRDGAQWIYLGQHANRNSGGILGWAIPKRISSVTLDGGIINLHDVTIKSLFDEIGLTSRLSNEQYGMEEAFNTHDYVRIGNLRGSGGIFRLDLNGEDKTQSDMVYVESGEGTHYFEPYDLTKLEPITPENTLTFALVGKGGSGLTFIDKQNIYGEALVDYELEIASREITAEDLANPENAYWDKTFGVNPDDYEGAQRDEAAAEKIDMSAFEGGTNWYIRRVTLTESAAAQGMTGAGWASYDAAVEMPRRDRRAMQAQTTGEERANGLWVRLQQGRSGIDNQYRWDRSGVTVGLEREFTQSNRVGAWFAYTRGDTEFFDISGTGDMKRYELALYDTLSLGSQYLDFVARFGRVESEFDVGNVQYQTSGSFGQNYAALSAEYGIHLSSRSGFFAEPQLQLQAARLGSYDYEASRGMRSEVDSETSLMGRVGLRAGRSFSALERSGSIYVRGDLYHQFTDGESATMRDQLGHRLDVVWGDNDTWAALGAGAAFAWSDRIDLALDAECYTGGDVDNAWLLTGRLLYRF